MVPSSITSSEAVVDRRLGLVVSGAHVRDDGDTGEFGWGVSSRGGSRWKSVEVIGSQQTAFVCSRRESFGSRLGAIGSHWEPLGAIGSHKQRVFV